MTAKPNRPRPPTHRRQGEPRVISRCPFCHEDLAHTLGTVCAACLARHHDDCWVESSSRCAACQGRAALVAPGPPPDAGITQALRILCVVLALAVLWLSGGETAPGTPAPATVTVVEPSPAVWVDASPELLRPPPPPETATKLADPAALGHQALLECRWRDAVLAFDDALAAHDRPDLHVARARALRELGDYELAIRDLDAALESDDQALAWRLARAELLLDLDRVEDAVADYRLVLSKRADPRLRYRIALVMAFRSGVSDWGHEHWLHTALDLAQAQGWTGEAEFLRGCLQGRERHRGVVRWVQVGHW